MPMLKPGGRLGLVLHPRTDPTPVAEKLERWARSHGKRVIADERHAARLPAGIELVKRDPAVVHLEIAEPKPEPKPEAKNGARR